MRWYLLAIFAYILAVAQTTLFEPRLLGLNAFGVDVRPDLLLLVALFVALNVSPGTAFVAAWALGMVEGLSLHAGEGPLGVTALVFALAGWLVCLARPYLASTRILTQVLLALVVVSAVRLPQQMGLLWLTDQSADGLFLLRRSLGDAAYSAVLAPYLMWLLTHTTLHADPALRSH